MIIAILKTQAKSKILSPNISLQQQYYVQFSNIPRWTGETKQWL